MNDDEVNLYAWIVDGGGDNGIAWLGSACKTGSGENSKTSLVRGPSRYNAIIETAEVFLKIFIFHRYLIDNILKAAKMFSNSIQFYRHCPMKWVIT